MAFTYSRLTEITTISDSAASVYSNPSSTTSYLRQILLHNTSSSEETVELWVVPDSGGLEGTAADANKIYEETLPSGATRMIEFAPPGYILEDENETLQAAASTASVVTISVMGAVE